MRWVPWSDSPTSGSCFAGIIQGLQGFRLVEKMGDGAFSNVYKAVDRTSGQKVAIKVVRKYELNSTQVSRMPFLSSPLSRHARTCECATRYLAQPIRGRP